MPDTIIAKDITVDTEKTIRDRIVSDVEKLLELRSVQQKFVPGKSKISYAGRIFDDQEILNLIDASLDFWLTEGKYAAKLESQLTKFIGVKYCALTNSGSSADLLAVSALTSPLLKSRRLKPGDEVITTACGFPTTLNPIFQNNLIPVFVDVDLGTYNINVKHIKKAVTKKTKAIVIAHTLGNPADLEPILAIAKKHNLWLIEDNCDALGSLYKGRPTGSFGHISTFSFYPAHHITTGEGGAVLTDDEQLNKIILSFRDWGRDCWCKTGKDNTCGKRFGHQLGELPLGYDHKYIYSHIGYNLKMTDLQAAIGAAQFEKLPGFVKRRQENFAALYQTFKKYEDSFILPSTTQDSVPSWFGFPILVKKNASFTRADIVGFLENNHIATRMLFGGNLTRQPAYAKARFRKASSLKNSDTVMNDLFWIGVYPGITEEKLGYIIEKVEEFMEFRGHT